MCYALSDVVYDKNINERQVDIMYEKTPQQRVQGHKLKDFLYSCCQTSLSKTAIANGLSRL